MMFVIHPLNKANLAGKDPLLRNYFTSMGHVNTVSAGFCCSICFVNHGVSFLCCTRKVFFFLFKFYRARRPHALNFDSMAI